jgi:hypothetical protein
MGFIDQMRSEGFAVESIVRVLREQGREDRGTHLPGLAGGPRVRPNRD